MNVTVVVPTIGESAHLRRSVESFLTAAEGAGPDAEVLVVVNGRKSVPVLDHVGSRRLRVVFLDERNVARARNVGIRAARHDTVLFGDDGGSVGPGWCAELAGALRDPAYPVVTAPVRVPTTGPVTAFLDYQRFFDAPPLDAVEARTVTGHCGLRRDRIPVSIRYDESNMPFVGEDVAFGHSLRAAGIPIRWLADVAPGWHLLPDRIEEITERAFRYGRGSALVWSRRSGPVAGPAEVLALYRYLGSADYGFYRRFTEVIAPSLRAAWTVYDYLYDLAYLLGYLAELGTELDHTFVDLNHEGLRRAWQDLASAAARPAGSDWRAVRLDYGRMESGAPTHDPLVAVVRRTLDRYAPLVREYPSAIEGTGGAEAPRPAGAQEIERLLTAWNDIRATDAWADADAIDRWARTSGTTFREACAIVERAFAFQYAVRAGAGAPSTYPGVGPGRPDSPWAAASA